MVLGYRKMTTLLLCTSQAQIFVRKRFTFLIAVLIMKICAQLRAVKSHRAIFILKLLQCLHLVSI